MPSSAVTPIVQYLKLLHDHGVGSEEAERFKKEHDADPTFARRAKAAEMLYQHRDQILEELDRLEEDVPAASHPEQRKANTI